METRLLHDADGQKSHAVILQTGDEAMTCLQDFARAQGITAAGFTAIGAFSRATLAYFDWQTKTYLPIDVDEQVEVASLTGDIALDPTGQAVVHMHAVLGRRGGAALAGHLQRGHVRPTLEVILTESPRHLRKTLDPATGLALLTSGADPALGQG
ncbi:PPC domain-containing DNA-binding protein [Paracoccus sp. NGMCC 1.201697]|uniref:PPC domain-containing DNA-binding protein n=1 Tax=Paracoccus broussonetiae subsp. drimophilus TaxID=3373869 RepID=A0ABW7LMF3_9RHOB